MTVRQSTDRTEPSSCAGHRAAIRSATNPHPAPTKPRTIARGSIGLVPRARECELDQGGVAYAGRSAWREGRRLAVIRAPCDVEMDPRLGDELAQEERALDEARF